MSKIKLSPQLIIVVSEDMVIIFLNTVAGNPGPVTGYTDVGILRLNLVDTCTQLNTRIRIIAVDTPSKIIYSGLDTVIICQRNKMVIRKARHHKLRKYLLNMLGHILQESVSSLKAIPCIVVLEILHIKIDDDEFSFLLIPIIHQLLCIFSESIQIWQTC